MAGELVREGAIPEGGVLDLLRALELARTSGVLRFETDGSWREVVLVAGQLALDQPAGAGVDPVEALLAARNGHFEVLQRLPPLPVSKGDACTRTGSLAVHVPVDLMTYCEGAGLTGTLELLRGEDRAEVVYDKGELTAIQYGGAGDVNVVFAWESGTFKIEALPVVPEVDLEILPDSMPPTPLVADVPASPAAVVPAKRRDETVPITRKARRRRDETGQNFLRVVETTLGAVVEEAERRRSPTRTSPPLPAPLAPRPDSLSPPRPSREAAVRIIYLTGDASPSLPPFVLRPSSRHVRTDVQSEPMLPDAKPERLGSMAPAVGLAASSETAPVGRVTIGLALGGLAVALLTLAGMVMWLH